MSSLCQSVQVNTLALTGAGIQSTLEPEAALSHMLLNRRLVPPFTLGARPFTMARIYPFRAWRYNPAHVRLDAVVTQPYDKISPAMQQAYYQSSPYNLVRIILGLPELFDA